MEIKNTRDFYPAIITGFNQDNVETIVQVDSLEMVKSFPRQVLTFHNLVAVGDRFKYFPNERQIHGVYNIWDFEPVERRSDGPARLSSNFLESLTEID